MKGLSLSRVSVSTVQDLRRGGTPANHWPFLKLAWCHCIRELKMTFVIRCWRSVVLPIGWALVAGAVYSSAYASNAWIGPMPVSSVISSPDGGFLLLLNSAGDPACGPSGNQFNAIPNVNGMTTEGAKAALAVLLTALALNKQVSMVRDDTQSGCPIQGVRIDQ